MLLSPESNLVQLFLVDLLIYLMCFRHTRNETRTTRGSVGPMEWILLFGNISHYFALNWLVFVSLY